MLYELLAPLADQFTLFNLFRYITFRTGGAVVTALIISFICGPWIINWLKVKQRGGQPIRLDGPAGHLLTKAGTPTMGGFLILLAVTGSTLLWADLKNGYVWVTLLVTAGNLVQLVLAWIATSVVLSTLFSPTCRRSVHMRSCLRSGRSLPALFCWGVSSVGRAPEWHSGGREFNSPTLHQYFRQ